MTWITSVTRAVANNIKHQKKKKQSFIDSLRLLVQGGAGGMGHPKYGGSGGKGGSVFVEGLEDMTLKDLKKSMKGKQRVKASSGQNSTARSIIGKPGDDLVIQCPTGVDILNEYGNILGQVLKEGDSVLVAEGGTGGCLRTGFSGTRGQTLTVRMDLKLIADIAFVGFPNAGKSTLLSKLSRANPKIASYPFTTLRPMVGVVSYPDGRQISLADLPGLIEGAHANRGLGHRFLRHVERSKVLLMVVDVNGFQLSHKYRPRSCVETVLLLNKEIELYKEHLLDKPTMLLINKMDTDGSKEKYEDIMDAVHDLKRVLHKYPEDVRPERLLDFVSVQKLSAKNASDYELTEYMGEIRRVLDMIASEEEAEVATESELMEKFKQRQTDHGPVVV